MPDEVKRGPNANDDNAAPNQQPTPALAETKTDESGKGDDHKTNRYRQFCEKYKMKKKWATFRRHGPQWIEASCAVALVFITGFYTYYASKQAAAAITAANAAQSAAETAKTALHVSEKAILDINKQSIDLTKKSFDLYLTNVGRIPTGKVNVVIHVAIVQAESGQLPNYVKDPIEHFWSVITLPYVTPGVPVAIHGASMQKLDLPLFKEGKQVVVTSGIISYNDGFPDSPNVPLKFCYRTAMQVKPKIEEIRACDADAILLQMHELDKYDPKYQR